MVKFFKKKRVFNIKIEKKKIAILFLILTFVSVSSFAFFSIAVREGEGTIDVIVFLEPDANMEVIDVIKFKHKYEELNGFAGTISLATYQELQNSEIVKILEEDQIVLSSPPSYLPDGVDTLNWGLDAIDAERVWNGTEDGSDVDPTRPSGEGVKVCIIDTGIFEHEDIMDNYKGGIDYYEDDYDPIVTSRGQHATAVASILCGVDNDKGIIGVAPSIDLYVARIYEGSSDDLWSISDLEAAITWACENDMDIISMNVQFYGNAYSLEFVCYCAYLQGRVLVAPAGNEHDDYGYRVSNPAAFEYVIAAGAADHDGDDYYRADFSCYGPALDFLAPGKDIMAAYGTIIEYMEFSGTCAASPFVSGICALMLSDNPDLTPDEIKDNLIDSCLDLGDPGKDDETGWGLVYAYECFDFTPPNVDITSPGSSVSGTVTVSANVIDDKSGINRVEFYIDNSLKHTDTYMYDGWSWSWNTEGYSNGGHTIKVKAYDDCDNMGQDTKRVYVYNGGGGGGECPNLLVWNGNEFIDEGVLPIHNEEDPESDMILYHELDTTPGIIRNHFVNLKLAEIGEGYEFTQSFINQVKLFALNTMGEWVSCPLIRAKHTRFGNVRRDIQYEDDKRVETLKGDEINLFFSASSPQNYLAYKFMIVGHNALKF